MKLLKRLLLALLALLVLAVLVGWLWLRGRVPDPNGTVQLPGQRDSVEVLYDGYGVPHVYAQSEADLFYAFGYVHARDRLFQMELLRRLADGRLAEVFGPAALPSDRFFRTLGFRHHAKRTLDSVYRRQPAAPFVRAAEAYVRGVNAFIESGETPLEFTLASIPKTPFTLEDCEIILGYMAFGFAEAFRSEAYLTTIQERLGPAYLADFAADWPEGEPMIPVRNAEGQLAAAQALGRVATHLTRLQQTLPQPPFVGSNGWVVAGSKTKSGKPILANDTHIGFAQPSVWYEAHLNCPGFNFYGNFLAGTPFGALGHNESGGWGLTMFENDDVDFYREKPNPENPNQVWFRDHWEELRTRTETIRVKDSADVVLPVRESRHGILIQDVERSLKTTHLTTQPAALWWTFLKFPNRAGEAFFELAHARTAAQAGAAVAKLHAPGLNVMWADASGNIAWWAAAKLPVRPAHVRPYLILDGSTGADDPTGWLPFSQNPQILNPERGVLYSANNQPGAPEPDDMGTGLVPGYYVPGDRARRIEQLLFTEKTDWTPETVRAVVNDVTNPSFPALLKDLLPLVRPGLDPKNRNQNLAYDRLLAWTGNHELTSTEPTVFYRFLYHIGELALRDELGELTEPFFNNVCFKRPMARWLRRDASPWWDNRATPARETRTQILTEAFRRAVADLEKQLGPDPAEWRWERVHTLTHKHPLAVAGPLLAGYFNVGPMPVPGGRDTINNLDFDLDSTGLYPVVYGPALRRVVDFADVARGTSVLPTGQSGHRASPHYADQAQLFAQGKARPELMNRADIERAATGRLVLKP
jgi:penicillin amidase